MKNKVFIFGKQCILRYTINGEANSLSKFCFMDFSTIYEDNFYGFDFKKAKKSKNEINLLFFTSSFINPEALLL